MFSIKKISLPCFDESMNKNLDMDLEMERMDMPVKNTLH